MEILVYVGTYAKYNNGSIAGEWINITDMSQDEYQEAIQELHKDEDDPEYMIQDTSIECGIDIFKDMISEYGIDEELWAIKDYINDNNIDLDDEDSIVSLHNEAQSETNRDDMILSWDDVEESLNNMSGWDAFRLGVFSDINMTHDHFRYDGYGNLESTSNPKGWVDEGIICEYLTQVV